VTFWVDTARPLRVHSTVTTPSSEAGFINQKQLLARLPISRRTLFNWRTTGKIPCVRLGGRRILFHWPSVEAALLRHQQFILHPDQWEIWLGEDWKTILDNPDKRPLDKIQKQAELF
jgi:predicted DNA-binding transcriptional regulator AlpA